MLTSCFKASTAAHSAAVLLLGSLLAVPLGRAQSVAIVALNDDAVVLHDEVSTEESTQDPVSSEKSRALKDANLRAVVERIYVYGMPFAEARLASAYSGAVGVLDDLLQDDKRFRYAPNAVIALGVSGQPEALAVLKRLVEAPAPLDRQLHPLEYRARLHVPVAMGCLVHELDQALKDSTLSVERKDEIQSARDLALKYLGEHRGPNAWFADAAWITSDEVGRNTALELVRRTTEGLSLSGNKTAGKLLTGFREHLLGNEPDIELEAAWSPDSLDGARTSEFVAIVGRALGQHDRVRDDGLASLYHSSR